MSLAAQDGLGFGLVGDMVMFTSGSMIGTRPWPRILPADLELLCDVRSDALPGLRR